jgi:hypothetical protein
MTKAAEVQGVRVSCRYFLRLGLDTLSPFHHTSPILTRQTLTSLRAIGSAAASAIVLVVILILPL